MSERDKSKDPKTEARPADPRKARLAEALRANLKKRRQQARRRATGAASSPKREKA